MILLLGLIPIPRAVTAVGWDGMKSTLSTSAAGVGVCVAEGKDELQRAVGDAETETKLGGPAGQAGSPAL